MHQHHVLLAVVLAGASLPAVADKAVSDPASWPDTSGNTSAWKGSLSRAEVTAEFLQARASGSVSSGEAGDEAVGMRMAAPGATTLKLPSLAAARAMGAAAADPVTTDGLRFVGGEAGYAPRGAPEYR